MTQHVTHDSVVPPAGDLGEESVALVRHWLAESAKVPADRAGAQLAALLKDPKGLDFTVGFIDGVIRPEDPVIAARNFALLARDVPAFLPWHLRQAVRVGALAGRRAPRLVIPVVRRALRSLVGHLVVDARPAQLGRGIAKIRREGVRLNINLLGEAVLGEREASRRLQGTHDLLARDDVDYVSVKVSAIVPPHSRWAFDEAVEHVAENLLPLYEQAAAAATPKFINLDMEEYHDLDLTLAVFTRILDTPGLEQLESGIVLQAYLPDAMAAMIHLQEWAAARRSRGGAGIKVRVVKGANLPMERVDAEVHGWPLATWSTKQETDAHYKRVLDHALHPERVANVRIGVAGHNLFDLAHAWLLAGQRGVREGVDFEMLLGMAQSQADVVRREVGNLLLYTPVVDPQDFDVAIAYLIRRLEEGASHDNFMSAVFELNDNDELFERERDRFLASLAEVDDSVPAPHRTQDRSAPVEAIPSGTAFANTPDTDPSLAPNRAWARAILERVPASTLGADLVEEHTLRDAEALESVVSGAVAAGEAWGRRSGAERAEVLERAAHRLEQRRADLLEVMASEAGKTLDQGDPEVSEAIDFARYYAQSARELDAVDGATFVPSRLTVVTPPWNFPVAIPAGSTLAALAAGSAVVIKPAPQAARCGSVMVEALWEAGVPREVLRLVHVDESDLGRRLVSDPRVDRLILTGAYETAKLFRTFRPDLPLLAETSGKNAIVVTPSADFDLAAKDIAASAFGHAGQKCSAASLVILVGSVAESTRFREQLVDAVTSLTVGWPQDPETQMGPLIEPAAGKLLKGLTKLSKGEEWLVEPRRLDEEGRLWTPGIRTGVKGGSRTHLKEYFGPVLGIMTADSLEGAIELQNAVDYGLTAGLHSLDPEEIELWLDRVEAGNLYVNRGTTGAIVRRQPFGGWKKSSIGPGTKAGGPHYLFGLGEWAPAPATAGADLGESATMLLQAARDAELPAADLAFLERAFASDALAWRDEFGVVTDVSGLAAERNILRYVPVPLVGIRLAEDARLVDGLRVIGAGLLSGARLIVWSAFELPRTVTDVIQRHGASWMIMDEAPWTAVAPSYLDSRLRLVGGSRSALEEQNGGDPKLAVHAHGVTESGRVELLPFLREQAISITAHRFGTPNHLTDALL
ncbi:1-pyrroline-5-carboxylate dehydrogenase [Aeromicrobium flavum]|uniref:L-glutamate gamma-semialdehyde dehydrogenase n=1 Tax=Aeromicrobium flavum TaxID=416568 RepID=A0A512HV06_9ACTN|nr:proline dehydrogenase family protein [Aeromicrobium flavum]GEO89240.1 1-pyrroline-5-carboxylate dehydrogenase [Aeromicrobium flavum]